jgi:hypothetical protein
MNIVKFRTLMFLLICTQIGRAEDPLDTWTWRNPLPTGNALSGIAYGNGQFVAVGSSGNIVTSADGANWVLRQPPTHDLISGIAYGNGLFVAVGSKVAPELNGAGQPVIIGGAILTSTDGVTWVQSQSVSPRLSGVAYGNGQFMAWQEANNYPLILTSPDGLNWVQRVQNRVP